MDAESKVAELEAQLAYIESMLDNTRALLGSEVRDDLPIPRLEVELLGAEGEQRFVWRYSLVLGGGDRLRRSLALEVVEQGLAPHTEGRDPREHIPHGIPWRSDASELNLPVVLAANGTVSFLRGKNDA